MATLGERVATLEADFRNMRDDVRAIEDDLGDKRDPNSIRGRLHQLEGYIGSAVARRAMGAGLLKGWERFALVLAAFGTMAAAWYGALH